MVQTTSPLVARRSFWTVVATIESVGLRATPYHAHVPSFGEWGCVLASRRPWRMPTELPRGLRFLDLPTLALLFDFPRDMARVPAEVNRLSNQVLVQPTSRSGARCWRIERGTRGPAQWVRRPTSSATAPPIHVRQLLSATTPPDLTCCIPA